jgi:hypothetical protein
MKKKCLIIPFLTLSFILILTLLPISFISADPGNLVENGDFSDGLDHWGYHGPYSGNTAYNVFWNGSGTLFLDSGNPKSDWYAYIEQLIDCSNKNFTFSFYVWPVSPYSGNDYVEYGFGLLKNGVEIGSGVDIIDTSHSITPGKWNKISLDISDWLSVNPGPLPDFDAIPIGLETIGGCQAYFDNVKLVVQEKAEEPVWVRTQEMTCKQVWVNEDNKFQFSFIYPYRDNNWVRIYDMTGKMVYEIDMPYDNPNIIVDLPDGMYTVKTFTVGSGEPIQTFVIGK